MLETEAKNKWCPMARIEEYNTNGIGSFNRLKNSNCIPDRAVCFGDRCAGWIDTSYTSANPQERTGHCGLTHK